MKEMKRNYCTPAVEVITYRCEAPILGASDVDSNPDPTVFDDNDNWGF